MSDYIGLYDHETVIRSIPDTPEYMAAMSAFGPDFIHTFACEAVLGRDEYEVQRDRYGRTPSQNSVIRIEVLA
jgi:hypothetical protein